MCGIVGIISKQAGFDRVLDDTFAQLLFADQLRGFDSTGMFIVPKNNAKAKPLVYKRALSAAEFLDTKAYKKRVPPIDTGGFVVGHNRSATIGSLLDDNAHPFQHGNITLVHNGTLYGNYRGLSKGTYDVDSEYICAGIHENGIVPTLENIEGAFAIAFHDAETGLFHLARNRERPLFFCTIKDKEMVFFASEQHMLYWIATRNNYVVETMWDVGKNQIATFDPSKKSIKEYKITKFKEYVKKPVTQPIRQAAQSFTPQYPLSKDSNGNVKPYGFNEITYVKATVEDLLKQYKLKVGQTIEFFPLECTSAGKKNKTMVVEGIMGSSPFLDVMCRTAKKRKVTGKYLLKGRIVSMEGNRYKSTRASNIAVNHVVMVDILDEDNQEQNCYDCKFFSISGDKRHKIKTIHQGGQVVRHTSENEHQENIDYEEKEDEVEYIRDERGNLITYSKFLEISDGGLCGVCNGEIGKKDAASIEWWAGVPIHSGICWEAFLK